MGAYQREQLLWGLPFSLWVIFFFIFPFIILIILSFLKFQNYQITTFLTLENYLNIFSSPFYLQSLIRSVIIGISVSLLTILLAYPFSVYLAFFVHKKHQKFILLFIILPLLTSFIIRAFTWRLLFSETGLFNRWLLQSGLIATPIEFLFNPFVIIFGIATYLLPFAIFIFYNVLSSIPSELFYAAKNLGARDTHLFSYIIFPLSKKSLLLVFMLSFIITLGDFIVTIILGGGSVYTFSLQILDVLRINNIPLAAAMGVLLIIIFMPLLIIALQERAKNVSKQ